MLKAKGSVLQNIASKAVEKLFGDNQYAEELVTSLIRQWRNCEGHATLLSPGMRHDCELEETEEGFELHWSKPQPFPYLEKAMRDQGIDCKHTFHIMHRLNVSQSVEIENGRGYPITLSLDSRKEGLKADAPTVARLPSLFCQKCGAVLPGNGPCRHCMG